MQRINITLPDELARDFRKYIPARKRSSLIAQAVSNEVNKKKKISKKEWIKSLKANRKLYEEEAKVWDTTIADGLDKW